MTPVGSTTRRSGRTLVALLAATVLLPGVLLVALGVRTLQQERRLQDQQLRERIDGTADLVVREFDVQVRAWESAVDELPRRGFDIATLPSELRSALAEPGVAVVLPASGVPFPREQLLYAVGESASEAASSPPLIATADRAEFQQRDLVTALARYERAASDPRTTPAALAGVGRVARKLGRVDRALAAYLALERMQAYVGGVPADLMALHEACAILRGTAPDRVPAKALLLYQDLVRGRWALDRVRYLYYAASARAFLGSSPPLDTRPWLEAEQRKAALTEAVAEYRSASPQRRVLGGQFLVFGRGSASGVLLVDRRWLAEKIWPASFRPATTIGYGVRVSGAAGDSWFGGAGAATESASSTFTATRVPEASHIVSRLTVFPANLAELQSDANRRLRIYVVMLVLLMALLLSGTVLVLRTVRREMDIARLQSDFVSAVSHEFRSPLTGIRQLAEMLARGRVPSEDRRQEYYERITRESDRLTRLVENVLDFSQMEHGLKAYRFEAIDTGPWLESVVDEARHETAQGARIMTRIPTGLPQVTGDQDALRSAVHNLLDNAVKYSPGRDTVWVEAAAENGGVAIRVRDEGVGIAVRDRAHIFDRFYRAQSAVTSQAKGAGLGLSLVAHIVQAHAGTVECDSRVGEGSTFTIRLHATDGNRS